jgi:microcystin degradation protein MlrC
MEAARLIVRIATGEVHPVMALAKPPLMPHIVRQRTADGPMAELIARARARARGSGVLRVSVAAGFAYADVPRVGMGMLAITDGDAELAAETVTELADAAWERRARFDARLPDAEEAVRRALAAPRGPVVLADLADNVGGGSPGDGTELLRELLEQLPEAPPNGPALALLADPEAVAAAITSGVRSTVRLSVGGNADTLHGAPVEIEGRVRLVADGIYRNRGPMRDELVEDQGPTVVLDCGPLILVLTSRKMPMWNLEQLHCLGIAPARLGIIVVKGAVAHRAAYGQVAAEMIEVETSGACAGDIRRFEYRNVRRPLYPLDEW